MSQSFWNIYRNDLPGRGGSYDTRIRGKLYQLKVRLVENGWEILGTGDGNSSFDVSGGDLWTSSSAISDGAWFWIKNADDLEVIVWYQDIYNVWLRTSFIGYTTGTGESATVPIGNSSPPADECDPSDDGQREFAGYVDHDATLLANSTSFLIFGRAGFNRTVATIAVVKLLETKDGDSYPYWFYRYGEDGYTGSNGPWLKSVAEDDRRWKRCLHPGGTSRQYGLCKYQCPSSSMMNDMPENVLTSEPVLHEVWVACADVGFEHVKGVLPWIYRVGSQYADNTKLFSDDFVVSDDYAFPWESSEDMWT